MTIYKGYRIKVTKSDLSVMAWKNGAYLNSFNSIADAKEAIDRGRFD